MNVSAPVLSSARIEGCRVAVFRIPTDAPESDGTLEWESTTLVVCEVSAAGEVGLGYTYADRGTESLIRDKLEPLIVGKDAFDIDRLWSDGWTRLRNLGRQGATAMAVSAVDVALWDLKAKLLQIPLVKLLGQRRPAMPLYGSGGFTSYTDAQLRAQFELWKEQGFQRFKMKVGRDPAKDPGRVDAARRAIGDQAELFVDANSAYTRAQALAVGTRFADDFGVTWFEEPLPPEDMAGLRFLRERTPPSLEITDGEYGYDLDYFRRLMSEQAVDVVMADLTRCGGITGFMKIATLCETWKVPLSSHCAPLLHAHPGCAAGPLRHAEYFHDHARIERMLFDGGPRLVRGAFEPDLSSAGHGIHFKWADAEQFAV